MSSSGRRATRTQDRREPSDGSNRVLRSPDRDRDRDHSEVHPSRARAPSRDRDESLDFWTQADPPPRSPRRLPYIKRRADDEQDSHSRNRSGSHGWGPLFCPKCGSTAEPKLVTANTSKNRGRRYLACSLCPGKSIIRWADELPPKAKRFAGCGFPLTEEQKSVLALATPAASNPNHEQRQQQKHHLQQQQQHAPGRVILVTAGAGTGKTTTMLELAQRLVDSGRSVQYLTFNKSATQEVRNKLEHPQFDARTCHSAAYATRNSRRRPELSNETELKREFWRLCAQDVDKLLAGMPYDKTHEAARDAAERHAHRLIIKTFEQFMKSERAASAEPGGGFDERNTHWEAQRWHEGRDINHSTPPELPPLTGHWRGFYTRCAEKIWAEFAMDRLCSFDSMVKIAQLERARLYYDVLLVDESQDLDRAQTDWLYRQASFGTDVYFVGDAAQAIYGFRHADPAFLLSLEVAIPDIRVEKRTLTQSFRFGKSISAVANTILFAKANCRVRTHARQGPRFIDYRLSGTDAKARVTSDSFLGQKRYKQFPVVFLAHSNIALFEVAAKLLGLKIDSPDSVDKESFQALDDDDDDDDDDLPRIALYGEGTNSGRQKWERVISELDVFYQVFAQSAGTLPFGEWESQEHVTWQKVVDDYRKNLAGAYTLHIDLILRLKHNTAALMEKFRELVVEPQRASEGDYDVLLSTVHAAKGCEWPVVELCDDFADLDKFCVTGNETALSEQSAEGSPASFPGGSPRELSKRRAPPTSEPALSLTQAPAGSAKFDIIDNNSNALNLWYVALTRAREQLSVPPKFFRLVHAFQESLPSFVETAQRSSAKRAQGTTTEPATLWEGKYPAEKALVIYHQLAVRWADEVEREVGARKLLIAQDGEFGEPLAESADLSATHSEWPRPGNRVRISRAQRFESDAVLPSESSDSEPSEEPSVSSSEDDLLSLDVARPASRGCQDRKRSSLSAFAATGEDPNPKRAQRPRLVAAKSQSTALLTATTPDEIIDLT